VKTERETIPHERNYVNEVLKMFKMKCNVTKTSMETNIKFVKDGEKVVENTMYMQIIGSLTQCTCIMKQLNILVNIQFNIDVQLKQLNKRKDA
jgi:hypothetical protein